MLCRVTVIETNMRNRFFLLAAVLCVASLAYFGGLFQYLDPERLRELLTESGAWGPLLVIVMFAFLEPFGVPGAIFMVAAATLWPFWLAFSVNLAGAAGAGMVGFIFARYLGRDWVTERMPDRFRSWNDRLSERGLPIVIMFRLAFFINPASHWALGLSKVHPSTALAGSLIGFAPWVAVFTYFGAEILTWIESQSAGIWVGIGLTIVAIVVFQKNRRRNAASTTS